MQEYKWLLKLHISKCKTVYYGQNPDSKYKYYLASTELEIVDKIKDLGILFDWELSFVSRCKEKINRAYSTLGIISVGITLAMAASH